MKLILFALSVCLCCQLFAEVTRPYGAEYTDEVKFRCKPVSDKFSAIINGGTNIDEFAENQAMIDELFGSYENFPGHLSYRFRDYMYSIRKDRDWAYEILVELDPQRLFFLDSEVATAMNFMLLDVPDMRIRTKNGLFAGSCYPFSQFHYDYYLAVQRSKTEVPHSQLLEWQTELIAVARQIHEDSAQTGMTIKYKNRRVQTPEENQQRVFDFLATQTAKKLKDGFGPQEAFTQAIQEFESLRSDETNPKLNDSYLPVLYLKAMFNALDQHSMYFNLSEAAELEAQLESPDSHDLPMFNLSYHSDSSVLVVDVNAIRKGLVSRMKAEMKQQNPREIDGIVLDLRDNNGGHILETIELASLFLPGKTSVSMVEKRGDRTQVRQLTPRKYHDQIFPQKLVILLNEETTSSAEVLASILRERRKVLVLGANKALRSRGKGTAQLVLDFSVPYGEETVKGAIALTFAGVGTPDLRFHQYHGVPVDISLPQHIFPKQRIRLESDLKNTFNLGEPPVYPKFSYSGLEEILERINAGDFFGHQDPDLEAAKEIVLQVDYH